MTTIQETDNQLVIRSLAGRRRLIIGLTLLVLGLCVTFAIFLRLVRIRTLIAEELTQLPQVAQSEEIPSSGEVVIRLGYEGVRRFSRGPRPVVALAILSSISGLVILARYQPGQVTTFDKIGRQIILVEPDRFFRPQVSHYPFDAIAAIREERDRSYSRIGDDVYSVQVEIDLNAATQTESDFVYRKPIVLTQFSHSRDWAQALINKIEAFTG